MRWPKFVILAFVLLMVLGMGRAWWESRTAVAGGTVVDRKHLQLQRESRYTGPYVVDTYALVVSDDCAVLRAGCHTSTISVDPVTYGRHPVGSRYGSP